MPTNIELKFRVNDLDAFEQKASQISDTGPETLLQEDIFFNAHHGRLKLRKFECGNSQLIAYHRDDSDEASESQWHIYSCADPDGLQAALTMTVGQGVTVRKRRILYLAGNTRIHLDRVDGLGEFVELEVVLGDDESAGSGLETANRIVEQMGLDECEPIAVAYADLLTTDL